MSAPEVLLFTIDAGGGHRAAARALAAAAEETGAPFRLRVVSFQETLLPLDVLKRATGVSARGRLQPHPAAARERAHGAAPPADARGDPRAATRPRADAGRLAPRAAAAGRRRLGLPELQRRAARRDPRGPARRAARRGAHRPRGLPAPLLDRARDRPRGRGHRRGRASRRVAIGIPAARVTRVSGMVLHPRFYGAGGPEARARARAGLRPGRRRLRGDAFSSGARARPRWRRSRSGCWRRTRPCG